MEENKIVKLLENISSKVDKLEGGLKKLEEGQRKLEGGQRTLEEGQRTLEGGQRTLEEGQRTLEGGQKTLEEGQRTLEGGQKGLKEGLKRLEKKVETIFEKVGENFEEICSIKTGFESLQTIKEDIKYELKGKPDLEELQALENRVSIVERRLSKIAHR